MTAALSDALGRPLTAPPWIAHDGSDVCPVEAGHDVEINQNNMRGNSLRGSNPEKLSWEVITHYRDWTAFAQASEPPFIDTKGLERLDADFQRDAQASEPLGDVAEWAIERVDELRNVEPGQSLIETLINSFARYIAAHEPAPVDRNLLRAREIAARVVEGWRDLAAQGRAEAYRSGIHDDEPEMAFILAALRARLPAALAAAEGDKA